MTKYPSMGERIKGTFLKEDLQEKESRLLLLATRCVNNYVILLV